LPLEVTLRITQNLWELDESRLEESKVRGDIAMKIKSIRMKKFKRFTDLTICNIPESAKLVVLVGPNGCGKTSVFEAFNQWYRRCGWNMGINDFLYFEKSSLSTNLEQNYFDIYDRIINDKCSEEDILKITSLSNEYEELLYEIYLIIKRKINNIIGIDWINKKFM